VGVVVVVVVVVVVGFAVIGRAEKRRRLAVT